MKKVLLCLSSILLFLFISIDARAYLFQQLPGSEFMSYTSNSNEDYGTSSVADNFMLTSAAQINSIKWWGFNEPERDWSGTYNFTFTFYSNNSGSPGSPILTTSGSFISGDWGSGVSFYSSVLNDTFNASANTTYWLSIVDTRSDSIWGWMMSNGGTSFQKFDDGEWFQNPMWSNAAFELSYTPIPIPPAAWLFASGLIGLMLIRRRRRMR